MKRRDLMKLVLVGPVAGALSAAAVPGRAVSSTAGAGVTDPSRLRPEILDVLSDRRRTKAIAAAYRRARPRESLEEIERKVRAAAVPDRPADRGPADAIRRLVRREYANGRTLELDGWILSETEARQCVLYETTDGATT